MPIRVTTYAQAFEMLSIRTNDKLEGVIARLEGEGRNEKSICFALYKGQDNIRKFRGDPRFYSVFENEVRKWAWSWDDPRWKEYNKKKEEQLKADEIQREADEEENKFKTEQLKYKAMKADVKFTGPGFIYFIQGASGGPIKIGYTANIGMRLKELQTGFPDTLIILCAKKGWINEERDYHRAFSEYRLKGEWFKPVDEILTTISKIKDKQEVAKAKSAELKIKFASKKAI